MVQENRVNFAAAQQLNDTILMISGIVLGLSIVFLSRAESMEYSLLLQQTWTVLATGVLLKVFARAVSPEPGDSDRFAILCWRFLAPLSADAFLFASSDGWPMRVSSPSP